MRGLCDVWQRCRGHKGLVTGPWWWRLVMSVSSAFARGLVSGSTDCVACVCLMRRASVLRLRLDLAGGVADWLFRLPSSTWAAVWGVTRSLTRNGKRLATEKMCWQGGRPDLVTCIRYMHWRKLPRQLAFLPGVRSLFMSLLRSYTCRDVHQRPAPWIRSA